MNELINCIFAEIDHNDTIKNMSTQKSSGGLWIFGDSVGLLFHYSLSSNILCKKIFLWCNNSYNWVYPLPAFKGRNDNFNFRPLIVLNAIRDVLQNPKMKRNDSVLVLNLLLHYTMTINFTMYQELIKDVIKLVKTSGEFGCKANFIWKTSTAIHKERTGKEGTNVMWRFFTPQVTIY